jgi:hypothetical protein
MPPIFGGMKNLNPSQIIIPAVLAAVLVLVGVGIGVAVTDDGDDDRAVARALPGERGLRDGPRGGEPGPRGGPGGGFGLRGDRGGPAAGDPDLAAVLGDVRAAINRQAPSIAKPILDKAVRERKITQAQADRIRERLERRGG